MNTSFNGNMTSAPPAPSPVQIYTSTPQYAVYLFLACVCAVLLGTCIVFLVISFRTKKWPQVFCLGFIALIECLGFVIFSATPFLWASASFSGYLSIITVRIMLGLMMEYTLALHWVSIYFHKGPVTTAGLFSRTILIFYVIGMVAMFALYTAFLITSNVAYQSLDLVVLLASLRGLYISSGVCIILFAALGLVVIFLFILRLRRGSENGFTTRLAMAVIYTFVLSVAGSLVLAGSTIEYSELEAFGISVSIELLSQIAYFLVIATFSPSIWIDEKKTSGTVVDGNSSKSNAPAQSATLSLTMEIDD